jgi:response regulator RpfG family c-di-GMP phosphodiesterase
MGEREKILILDDDPTVRDALGDMLHEVGGYQVEQAGSGAEALAKVSGGLFGVVMADVRMPGMDGIEFLRKVKEYDPALPVVMITGFPTVDVAIQAMKAGASDFITKPFKYERIEIILGKLVRERQLRLENARLHKELDHKQIIENLNDKLNKKVKELALINSISEMLDETSLKGDSLFSKIARMSAEITSAQKSYLRILDKKANTWVLRAGCGVDDAGFVEEEVPFQRVRTNLGRRFFPRHSSSRARRGSPTWPFLTVPLRIRGEVFGVITVSDKTGGEGFIEEDLLLLRILAEKSCLNIENDILYETVYHNLASTLQSLVKAIEARDQYTHRHSERVTKTAVSLAREMGCTRDELDSIRFAGMLHDMGKIGISDTVLLKRGPLTEEEMRLVRTHPVKGEEILRPLGLFPVEESLIRHHHERWDGEGYPDGLKGSEIPFLARILNVADSLDAMTSPRPYGRAKSWKEVLMEVERCNGSQFDPDAVAVLMSVFADPVSSALVFDGMSASTSG